MGMRVLVDITLCSEDAQKAHGSRLLKNGGKEPSHQESKTIPPTLY